MENLQPLLQELSIIRWLLIGLILFAALSTLLFFVFIVNLIGMGKENMRDKRSESRLSELEELLATGKAKEAKYTALEWLAEEPRRSHAHWALAKAHHQLGELTDAKRILQALLSIAPDEDYRVNPWLSLIEQDFNSKRPQAID